jgi:hypothetical protein
MFSVSCSCERHVITWPIVQMITCLKSNSSGCSTMINLLWSLLRAELSYKQGITKRRFVRGIKDQNYVHQFLSSLIEFCLSCICSNIPTPSCTIFISIVYLYFYSFFLFILPLTLFILFIPFLIYWISSRGQPKRGGRLVRRIGQLAENSM